MAVSYLLDAGETLDLVKTPVSSLTAATLVRMIEKRIQTPLTSSAGRLFDAVAALAGVRQEVHYEGQAAVELEWLASRAAPAGCYPFDLSEVHEGDSGNPLLVIDTRPVIRAVARDVRLATAAGIIGRRFHATLADIVLAVCRRLRSRTDLDLVVLTGGVFLNALLTEEVLSKLSQDGFRVFRQRQVPPNDGGLCLGQLAIAAARQIPTPLRGKYPMSNDQIPKEIPNDQ